MSLAQQTKTSHAFQSFRSSIPQELLLLIFHHLTPFQRCLLLSICKSWNQILLSTKSFWQILDVPFRLEISTTTISILQLFGSRSGYTLKQVIFENVFYESQAHLDHLDSLFQELEKSSNSLKVLVIPQCSSLNKVTRHFVREFLPNLKFLYSHNHTIQLEKISEMRKHLLEWESQYSIEERNDQGKQSVDQDDDGEEATFEEEQKTGGLEFYLCSEISDIKRFEEDWFRELKTFETYEIDSVKSFLRILNAAKSSLKHLNLKELEWAGRIVDDEWRPVGEDLTEVVLENPKLQFIVPKLQGTSNSLSKLIKFQSPDLRIIGPAQALVHFKFNFLKFAEISLYDDEDDQSYSWDTVDGDRVLDNTFSFLKKTSSILELTLKASEAGLGGGPHLTFILEHLISPWESFYKDENQEQNQLDPKERFFLPYLRLLRIEINDLVKIEKDLLENVLEFRRARNQDFRIQVWKGNDCFEVDQWEGQSWIGTEQGWKSWKTMRVIG